MGKYGHVIGLLKICVVLRPRLGPLRVCALVQKCMHACVFVFSCGCERECMSVCTCVHPFMDICMMYSCKRAHARTYVSCALRHRSETVDMGDVKRMSYRQSVVTITCITRTAGVVLETAVRNGNCPPDWVISFCETNRQMPIEYSLVE